MRELYEWYQKLWYILGGLQGVSWDVVDKAGSELTDIETRQHSMLQSVLGTGDRHVTLSENAELTGIDSLGVGIVARTADVTYAARSIQGTSNEVTVSFGDGAAGNPTVSLPDRIEGPRSFGGETAKATIEADGTVVLEGDATGWRDENFSGAASSIGPGAAALVNWDTSSILVPSFPHNLTKELQLIREYDHAGKAAASITPHAHLFPSNTVVGTAKLFLEYYIKNDGLAAITGTLDATLTTSGTAWEELRLSFPAITSVLISQGTQIGMRLYRLSTDPGTYAHPVAVSTWGYHYEIDTPAGSRQITSK